MTLEDFFTLKELENGLTTPDRVNELITKMQSEKDLLVNSFGQTTQQWSRVATIIAATKNNDCLDLFIQLNGLLVFNKWLKDAQKLKNDDENEVLEDLIISLLRALEKLQTDDERLFSSGIKKTVQDLVANNSHTISEKAKELCDNWRLVQDDNKIMQDAKNSKSVESQTKNQELMDHVDPSSKSTDNEDNEDNGGSSSKSEGVGKSDVKNENEINFRGKTDLMERTTLSSPLEPIASNANVDDSSESCIKTDVLSDKDDDMADDGESLKTSSNSDVDNEADNTIVVQSNGNSENGSSFKKLSTDNKISDMELDYGMIDPLDIARQVAVEVEREVDSPERSCTSDKTPVGVKRPNTPESENGLEIQGQGQSESQNQPVGGSDKEVSPEPVKDAETLVSQISEVAQGSELDPGRPFSGFDLNQEVCSEEVDNLDNPVSSSTSVVYASHAPAAGRIPAAPLGLEGTLGKKGSAFTNVSQAVPEDPGTHNNSNQRLDSHDFDLNVAEGGEEDKMVIIPGLPSGEESSVANPRKPERLQWDLNNNADDQSRWQSPYHASSSSSVSSSSSSKQPSLRNIDLNLNDQLPNGEGSVISIFGARVEVKQNDLKPQPEPKVDFNHGRHVDSSMHHGHHNGRFFTMPVYGSSSHGMPTPMHTQIPYMVDSRGTPFAPQIMGSQSPSPFFMNMAAAAAPPPPPPPPQHNFDLNTGLMTNGGLRQFLPQHVNEHAASSSVLGKRHEPDSSWQFLPVSKRQQPSWR